MQPVALAVQFHQFGAGGHVQAGEPVGVAEQILELCVGAQIQGGEQIVARVQRDQGGEMLDALEAGDAFAGHMQRRDGRQLLACEQAVRPAPFRLAAPSR